LQKDAFKTYIFTKKDRFETLLLQYLSLKLEGLA